MSGFINAKISGVFSNKNKKRINVVSLESMQPMSVHNIFLFNMHLSYMLFLSSYNHAEAKINFK